MQQLQLLICLKYHTWNDSRLLVGNEVDWMKQRPCRNSNPGHEFFQNPTVSNNTEIQGNKTKYKFPCLLPCRQLERQHGAASCLHAHPTRHSHPSRRGIPVSCISPECAGKPANPSTCSAVQAHGCKEGMAKTFWFCYAFHTCTK